MRIIAGDFKGRKLHTPIDRKIRPTADKVKEAIFSMIERDLPEAVVVDLFCGTGGLGLEALSRGAAKAYFGDRSKQSLGLAIQNAKCCGAESRSVFLLGDWKTVLARIREPADLILLDPPYETGILNACLDHIEQMGSLADGGVVVAEHPITKAKTSDTPDIAAGWSILKQKRYGDTGVTIYERQTEAK